MDEKSTICSYLTVASCRRRPPAAAGTQVHERIIESKGTVFRIISRFRPRHKRRESGERQWPVIDHLNAHVDTLITGVDEGVTAEITVMGMAMNDPAAEIRWCIAGIMDEKVAPPPVGEDETIHRCIDTLIVISPYKCDFAVQ